MSIHPSGRRPSSGVCPPPPSRVPYSVRLPALISLPHPSQVTILTCPPLPPLISRPPPAPPTSTLPHVLTCLAYIVGPAYPPLTSPALPLISFPPPPPVQLLTWLTLCPSASKPLPHFSHLSLPLSSFTLCILFSCITNPALFLHTFPHTYILTPPPPAPHSSPASPLPVPTYTHAPSAFPTCPNAPFSPPPFPSTPSCHSSTGPPPSNLSLPPLAPSSSTAPSSSSFPPSSPCPPNPPTILAPPLSSTCHSPSASHDQSSLASSLNLPLHRLNFI